MKGSNFDDKASNCTARFLLICLFLSVKFWCKLYFKPLSPNSHEERLTTGILELPLLTGFCNINLHSFLFLHFNWLMLSSLDDLSIKLNMQLKINIPTLFFKLSEVTVYLMHKSFKLCLCAVKCDCNIDFSALYLYTKNVVKVMCKKSIFKKLLIKLMKECTFSVSNRLIKQIDGCAMGGTISVVFADIYICKMVDDVVAPLKPIFYKRYVDDTYVRRKKNTTDELFENTYHDNIKLTIEENPTKFLDTEIVNIIQLL